MDVQLALARPRALARLALVVHVALSTDDRAGRLYAAAILLATLGLWLALALAGLSRCSALCM